MAEFERVEKILLCHPFALIYQLAVHQRNLSLRPAKAEQADAGEWPQQVGKGHGRGDSR
jgi:hypothetical protein